MPLFAALALTLVATADFEDTYAITNARIEVGDGRVIERGTVMIREGRIAAVGPDAQVPRHADVIDGKGLTVYPGFIDSYATEPLATPETPSRAPGAPRPAPPDAAEMAETARVSMRTVNRRGIRPDLRAADGYTLSATTLRNERAAGFVAMLVAPSGGTINGRAALVELSREPAREAVLVAEAGMAFGFRPGSGAGYPGSLLGVIANLRQAMIDAGYQAEMRRVADAGGSPAPYDPALDALETWRRAGGRTFWEAESETELGRARRLAAEFRLPNLTLVGALEAHRAAKALAQDKVTLVVGVNFGAEPPAPPRPNAETPNTGDDQPANLSLDRQTRYAERVGNLARLHEAGVRFALTGRGTRDRAEFFRNLRRAVDAGLPREAALRALTLTPAELFGLSRQMGTVEAGKLATLTVMNGDFLNSESRVRYMFLRGKRFRPDRERPPATPPRILREDDHDHHPGGGGR